MTWQCLDCIRGTDLDRHGRCQKCGSDAVMQQGLEAELVTSRTAYLKLLDALDSRLPDTELLGHGTVRDLVSRRMSVLNHTAQAMIEEMAGEEIGKHKPRMPVYPEGQEKIPSYDELTHCECGLRYAGKMPEAHKKHVDKVLASKILTVRDGVIKARQVNWRDVKDEADSWHREISEPTPS